MQPNAILQQLARSLIVSCQPVVNGPLDETDIVVRFAQAALAGGATGLRIEGQANVTAVRAATNVPIIGLIKRDLVNTPVRITPYIEDVKNLAAAGADIIAFDATNCPHPVAPAELCAAIHYAGKLAMADLSTLSEAQAAVEYGADLLGSTLAGYTGGPVPEEPDIGLIQQLTRLDKPVIAEGRIKTPLHAQHALQAGAFAVVVGSAITRPEHITSWFVDALKAPDN